MKIIKGDMWSFYPCGSGHMIIDACDNRKRTLSISIEIGKEIQEDQLLFGLNELGTVWYKQLTQKNVKKKR